VNAAGTVARDDPTKRMRCGGRQRIADRGEALAMAIRDRAWLAALAAGVALLVASMPAVAHGLAWPQAVERLAREKTLAEACASILKTFAEGLPMARVQGERLYARAQADMNGLVRLVIADLASQRSPADSPELRHLLEAVPRQRQALCDHVDAAVGTTLRQQAGRTGAADLLAEGSSDPAGSIADVAVWIGQAYRKADPAVRATIVARIEAIRWLPYAEVPVG
jgi:hypothetical protein